MQNLEIEFNKNIVKKVKSLNFQVDQLGSILFILFSLYENRVDLLDEFDDHNKQKRAILLYKELEVRGLISAEKEGYVHFTLTKAGIELVEFIKGEFNQLKEQVQCTDIAIKGVDQLKLSLEGEEVETWIDQWVDIFPKGVKSGGRLIRSDKQSCIRKMKVFIREYNYDKETIMEATRRYIDSKRNEGFAYTRCAVYFIYRVDTSKADKISDLADWCAQVADDNDPNTQTENNLEIMV